MMEQIFDFWFSAIQRLMNFFLQFDTGLGFSLGHLIIVALIFTVVIRHFSVLGN